MTLSKEQRRYKLARMNYRGAIELSAQDERQALAEKALDAKDDGFAIELLTQLETDYQIAKFSDEMHRAEDALLKWGQKILKVADAVKYQQVAHLFSMKRLDVRHKLLNQFMAMKSA